MTVEVKLVVERRAEFGTAACRRLRRQGIVPGNFYGHGVEPVSISLTEETMQRLIQTGAQVVDVELDGELATAVVREIQWDTFAIHIQHIDLVRVGRDERITVDVVIELRGLAKGVAGGGVLDQALHTLRIDCPAIDIPDKLVVRIGDLDIDQVIRVSDVEVPDGADILTPLETTVARVTKPVEVEEDEVTEAGVAEPELIGRKAEDAESAENF